MSELDYARLESEAAAGSFEAVSAALGVDLDAASWAQLERESPALVLAVIRRALLSSDGLAYERVKFTHVLAVRVDGAVVVGVKSSDQKNPSAAWPSLEGWKPRLESNLELAKRWATSADQLSLKVRADFRVVDAHDEEQKFLDAISNSPDDDDLRLVFADWLEERGDARGEFIRLQLAEAKNPYGDHDRSLRLRAMTESSWRNFAGELAKWSDQHSFRRGLVARVLMTPAAFAKEGERLFSKYPLQSLSVNAPKFTEKQLLQVVNTPAISRVRRLFLFQLNPSAQPRLPLASIAKGTHFDSLRGLSFASCGFSGEDWESLFMRLEAPLLEELEFSFNHTHPRLWRALAKSPSLINLKSIDEYVQAKLADGERDDFVDAMRSFAESRPKLETLILSQVSHLDDMSLAPLFSSSSVVQLRTLDINGAQLTDATLRAWAGRLGEMKSLTVRNASFTADGVAKFLETCPPKLEHLSLIAFDPQRWTGDALGVVYEALLRLPANSTLKRVALPYGRREDPLWERLVARFEVER